MYQRSRVLQLWEQAGIKKSRSKHVRDFVKFVEKTSGIGWQGYAKKLRKDYPRAFKEVITPLLESDDPLITANILHTVDLKKKNERDTVTIFAQKTDSKKHAFDLELLVKIGTDSIKKELEKRKDLPPRVRQLLVEQKHGGKNGLPKIETIPTTRISKS